MTATRRRPDDHGPSLAAEPGSAPRERGDDLGPIAILGKRRGDLRHRKLDAGNRPAFPADLADPQRVQPLIDGDHPNRGDRHRLHLAVCRLRHRDSPGLGAGAAPRLFGRRGVSPPRCGRLSCLGWCPHL
jgi:hypothetical protein